MAGAFAPSRAGAQVSAAAISWARGSGARGSAQAVLLALASYHNARTGECRPGLNALCRSAGLSRPTVCSALSALCEGGFITWTKGSDARGQRATNIYTLHMVSAKPRVKLPDSGLEKPRVNSSDVGQGIPELRSATRTKKERAATNEKVSEEGETPTPAPSLAGCGSCGSEVKTAGENVAQAETLRPETLRPACVAVEIFEANGDKKISRPCLAWSLPRLRGRGGILACPSPAYQPDPQADAALRDVWAAFDAMDDPHNPDAWR